MAEWNDFGWKQLADEAQAGMRGQGAIVEAMHRPHGPARCVQQEQRPLFQPHVLAQYDFACAYDGSSGCCDQSVDVITGCALHGQGHRGCKGGLRPFPWLHYGRGEEQIGGSPKIDCCVRGDSRSLQLIPTALFAGHARSSSDQTKTFLQG